MRVFKIIDLLIQGLLILGTFLLAAAEGSYITAMIGIAAIGSWHLVSAFIHLFFHHPAILRKERYVYWGLVVIYFVAAMAVMSIKVDYGSNESGFVTMMAIACGIGVWYISICLREMMAMRVRRQEAVVQ